MLRQLLPSASVTEIVFQAAIPKEGIRVALRFARTAPVLVTGMPRSGTTWLARLLASGPGGALTGREPMNPRGRQYALGGTLPGWVRLQSPTARQRRALRLSYRGLNPLVYSRYGHRQWAALHPGVRLIVKDPFAMLSIPAVQSITGARPVLLFRHPGAALTSYRRMGWRPDLAELAPIVHEFTEVHGAVPGVVPLSGAQELDETGAMSWFWNALYGMALHDAEQLGDVVVLAHHDIAGAAASFCYELFARLGLRWDRSVADQLTRQDSSPSVVDVKALHNFGRPSAHVAQEWESKITAEERSRLEEDTTLVHSMLLERAFRPGPATT